jgi:hypothetical protein
LSASAAGAGAAAPSPLSDDDGVELEQAVNNPRDATTTNSLESLFILALLWCVTSVS